MACVCTVYDCSLRNSSGVCKTHFLCSYGRFDGILREHLLPYSDYRIRRYAEGALKATVAGTLGYIEIWSGLAANEVWYIQRRTKVETLVTDYWYVGDSSELTLRSRRNPMHLSDALQRAFALAGVQTSIFVPDICEV